MSIEAMKQALEALESIEVEYRSDSGWPSEVSVDEPKCDAAIVALRTAIKEAERAEKQKPRCVVIVEVFGKDWRLDYMSLPVGKHKLYTQEYVYNAPQRKPLTDEQLEKVFPAIATYHEANKVLYRSIARAIEAAHGIGVDNPPSSD